MAAAEGTVVVYTLEEETVPYRITSDIDSQYFTLGDFMFLSKRFNYRFFFLSLDPEFGTIKDEVFDASAVVPSSGGLVQAWAPEMPTGRRPVINPASRRLRLVPLNWSQDSTRISPSVMDMSNNVISEDIGFSTTTYSSTRIISGCSSSPGQHQTTSSGSPRLAPDHTGTGPSASEAILTSTPISWNCAPKRCRSEELSRQYQRYECPSQSLSDTYMEILARMRWYQMDQGGHEDMCGGQVQEPRGQEVMVECQEEVHSHRGQEVMNVGQGQEVYEGQKEVNRGQDVMDGDQRQDMDGYQGKVQRGHEVMGECHGQEVVSGGQIKMQRGHEVIDREQGQEVMDGGHNLLDGRQGDEEHVYVGQRNLYKPADCLWSNLLYSADLDQNFEDVPLESTPYPCDLYCHSGICPNSVIELTRPSNDTLLTDKPNFEKLNSKGYQIMADIPAATPDTIHAQDDESFSLDHNNNISQYANTAETRNSNRCKSSSLNPRKYPSKDVRPQTYSQGTPQGQCLKADELYPGIGIDSGVHLKKARKPRKLHNSRKYSVQHSKGIYSMILPQGSTYREITDAKIHGNDGQIFPEECPSGTLETNGNLASEDVTESESLPTTDLFSVSPLNVRKSVADDAKAGPRPTGIYVPESTSMMAQFLSFDHARSSRGDIGDLLQEVEVKDNSVGERGRMLERRTRMRNKRDTSIHGIDVQQEILLTPETNLIGMLDEDLKNVVDAMLNPSSGVEVKERKWLKCSIPNALFGIELIQWLRRREGISSYMLARRLAQVLVDCGVLVPFLSSQTRFVDEWYYMVKVKDKAELVH